MRIIQITDLHLGREGEDTRNIDVRANFLRILEAIPAYKPDLIAITGDICYKEPVEEVYFWLEEQVSKLNLATLIIPGNHDATHMIPHHFLPTEPDENDERYITVEHKNEKVTLLFLDTQKGSMGDVQLSSIDQYLGTVQNPVIIFMHHPPCLANVGYMDLNHSFQNRPEFQKMIFQYGQPVNIFCGHYHVEKSISVKNMHVHITPSNFFQIKQDQDEFGVDHYEIGFRVIDWNDGVLRHRVEYLLPL